MQFQMRDVSCPNCARQIFVATVEPHPSRPDLVHHNYECVNCGPVMTRVISISAEETAPVTQADQESHRDSP